MTPAEKLEKREEMWLFAAAFQSIEIATVSAQFEPEASYAPVLLEDGVFYLYLSQLAKHTRNLQQNPKLSLLFIESEQDAANLFARKRATFACRSEIIERDSEQWNHILDAMEDKHGEMMQMIRGLNDFQLFACTPYSAKFVEGFAQAYSFKEPFKEFKELD